MCLVYVFKNGCVYWNGYEFVWYKIKGIIIGNIVEFFYGKDCMVVLLIGFGKFLLY